MGQWEYQPHSSSCWHSSVTWNMEKPFMTPSLWTCHRRTCMFVEFCICFDPNMDYPSILVRRKWFRYCSQCLPSFRLDYSFMFRLESSGDGCHTPRVDAYRNISRMIFGANYLCVLRWHYSFVSWSFGIRFNTWSIGNLDQSLFTFHIVHLLIVWSSFRVVRNRIPKFGSVHFDNWSFGFIDACCGFSSDNWNLRDVSQFREISIHSCYWCESHHYWCFGIDNRRFFEYLRFNSWIQMN